MPGFTLVQTIAVLALPLLFAITVHEAAHGWVARRLGDPTAMMLGRLTLNPIKHIDPLGTVVIPVLLLVLHAPFLFGWAKPVPITWQNLRNPKRDMALVAAAGPASNLVMALFWALIAKIGLVLAPMLGSFTAPMVYMGEIGITINLVLMVLNLLPLPPLDGGRVLVGLLPGPWAWKVSRIEPYGFPILLVLLITGGLAYLIVPPINWIEHAIYFVTGL
ncbi:MAG: site-2 protease family protein [Chromatiales bacterium 21-64-14]|nr:MAG: site-2 protease family protein [Chromatiales bacterium 21-64-14]HQU15358.1 site-2 protease family protein [Gammaproteobacteria bacterium]